jgi:uncharacterized protein (TIGR03083 family)
MPTHLSVDEHLTGLRRAGETLRAAAATAGLATKVPTCPAWDVAELVTHQGMVHRWAAANLRGEADHDTAASVANAKTAADLLAWFGEGLEALMATIPATPDDVKALVFLKDAPPPRRFWARRQAHETAIHAVDAVSATLGRWPNSSDVSIDTSLAADGVDELLTGFITRGKGKLHTERPTTLLVRAVDTGHAWTLQLGDGPVVTTVGETATPDAVFSGTAVQLYLALWNRSEDFTADGPADLLEQWRSSVRVRWS